MEFYAELFCDETFSGRKYIIQALVTSVKIDDAHAHLTYDPNLMRTRDKIGRVYDENEGGEKS